MTEFFHDRRTGKKVQAGKNKSEPEKMQSAGHKATAKELKDVTLSKQMKRLVMNCVADLGIKRSAPRSPFSSPLLDAFAPKVIRMEGLENPLSPERAEQIRQSLLAISDDDRITDYAALIASVENLETFTVIFRKALLQHEKDIPQECLCDVLFMTLLKHCRSRLIRAVAPLSHEWTLTYDEPKIVTELPLEYSGKSQSEAAKIAGRLKVESADVDALMGQLVQGHSEGKAEALVREILLGAN